MDQVAQAPPLGILFCCNTLQVQISQMCLIIITFVRPSRTVEYIEDVVVVVDNGGAGAVVRRGALLSTVDADVDIMDVHIQRGGGSQIGNAQKVLQVQENC